MTEKEFDNLLRRALVDAALHESDSAQESAEAPAFSPSYRRWRTRFLKDPFSVKKGRSRPLWRRSLETAAGLLLVVSLSAAGLFFFSPAAQAGQNALTHEWREESVDYYFTTTREGPKSRWRPAYLPEGYVETHAWEPHFGCGALEYQNPQAPAETDTRLFIDYQTHWQPHLFISIDNEHSDLTTTQVSGTQADLFISHTPDWPSFLVWMARDGSAVFCVMGHNLSTDELIRVAESLEQIPPPLMVNLRRHFGNLAQRIHGPPFSPGKPF